MNDIEDFWKEFLKDTGTNKSRIYVDCFHLKLTEHWANALLKLVISGKRGQLQVACLLMKRKANVFRKLVI